MANYSAIKAAVNAYIKANGKKEITGRILNSVLNATIDSLGRYFQFAGGAMPTDDPGTPDQNVCYLAGEPGVYTNFGGITIENEEVALLFWDGEWTKQRVLLGIQEVEASVDNQVGTPSVDVSYSGGQLVLTFHNLKGEQGIQGDAAGFGTIGADINGGVGTPGVSVESSGDNTAKNLMFHFTNLKGETGVTSVVATIDDTSGTPSCQVSLVNGVLTLAFSGLKGIKGDTGVSADYPITLYNGLNSDATDQALTAAQGKVLDGKISQLHQEVDGYQRQIVYVAASSYVDVLLADIGATVGVPFNFTYDGSAAMTSSTQRIGNTNGPNQRIVNNGGGNYTQEWESNMNPNTTALRYWVNSGDTLVFFGEFEEGLEGRVSELENKTDNLDEVNADVLGVSESKTYNGSYFIRVPLSEIGAKEGDTITFTTTVAVTSTGVADGDTYLNNVSVKQMGTNPLTYKVSLFPANSANFGRVNELRVFWTGSGSATFEFGQKGLMARMGYVEKYIINPLVKNICHRGYSQAAPEDTIPAMVYAKQKGFDFVEADLWFTSDGVPVIVHERNLASVSDGTGNVDEVTFAYFKSLDFGQGQKYGNKFVGLKGPSFEEMVSACKQLGLCLYIDCKKLTPVPSGYENGVQVLKEILDKYLMCEKATFLVGESGLEAVRHYIPDARVLVVAETVSASLITLLSTFVIDGDPNTAGLDVAVSALSSNLVESCHSANICCEAWISDLSVNGYPEDIQLWLSYGIDGLTADGADIVSATMQMLNPY